MDFTHRRSVPIVMVLLAITVSLSDNMRINVKTPFCTFNFDTRQYTIRCADVPSTIFRDGLYIDCNPYCNHPLTKFELVDSKLKNLNGKTFNSIRMDLATLNLSRNEMTKLERTALMYLNKLTSLDVSYNELIDIEVIESSSIKYLNLSNNRLNDSELVKIRNYNNLVHLDLSANLLTDLGTSQLLVDSLQTLLLNHNEITHTNASNFEGTPHIQNISLAYNNIEYIDCATFEHLTELESVDVSNNLINNMAKSIILTDCAYKIKILDLSYNNISDIAPGIFNQNLEDLNLSNNHISLCLSANMLSGATNIKKLNLSFNNISAIEDHTFNSITHLRSLDLSGNKLTQMNYIFNLKDLHMLNLSNNRISVIKSGTFSSSIYDLDLSYNQINISLKMDIFSGLTNLGKLNMSFNNISIIHDHAFKHNDLLHELDFTGNLLTRINITNDLRELRRINIAQNSIHTFEHGNKNNTLKWLDLKDNKLNKIDLSSMKTLNIIEIQRNNLSGNYTVYCQSSLYNISISENQIRDLKFYGLCTGLDFLNVSSNRITNLSITQENQMISLKWFDVSKNNLTSIKSTFFSQTVLLTFINLSKNMISTILPGTFANLSSLLHIDLSHNGLTTLPYGLFTNCSKLQHIIVSHNKLKEFNLHVIFPMKYIKRLYLDGNRLQKLNLIDLNNYLKDKIYPEQDEYYEYLSPQNAFLDKISVFIGVGNNDFDCKWLSEVYHAIEKDKIVKLVSYIKSWQMDNVEGISCLSEKDNLKENKEVQQNRANDLAQISQQINEIHSNRSIFITVLIVNICFIMLYIYINRERLGFKGYYNRNVYNGRIENEDSVELM